MEATHAGNDAAVRAADERLDARNRESKVYFPRQIASGHVFSNGSMNRRERVVAVVRKQARVQALA